MLFLLVDNGVFCFAWVPREAASSPVHLAKCSTIISNNNHRNKKNMRRYIWKYSIRIIILYVWQHYVQIRKVEGGSVTIDRLQLRFGLPPWE
jgi:hypothetical protein